MCSLRVDLFVLLCVFALLLELQLKLVSLIVDPNTIKSQLQRGVTFLLLFSAYAPLLDHHVHITITSFSSLLRLPIIHSIPS